MTRAILQSRFNFCPLLRKCPTWPDNSWVMRFSILANRNMNYLWFCINSRNCSLYSFWICISLAILSLLTCMSLSELSWMKKCLEISFCSTLSLPLLCFASSNCLGFPKLTAPFSQLREIAWFHLHSTSVHCGLENSCQ